MKYNIYFNFITPNGELQLSGVEDLKFISNDKILTFKKENKFYRIILDKVIYYTITEQQPEQNTISHFE